MKIEDNIMVKSDKEKALFVNMNAFGRSYYTSDVFTLSRMLEIVIRDNGYDGIGDLNRLSGIKIIINKIF